MNLMVSIRLYFGTNSIVNGPKDLKITTVAFCEPSRNNLCVLAPLWRIFCHEGTKTQRRFPVNSNQGLV